MRVEVADLNFLMGAACAALLASGSSASAECVSISFERQVSSVPIIFVGDVTRADVERLPTTIVTHYHFEHITYLKGQGSSDSVTVTQEGGRVGNREMGVEDTPHFQQGRRYVLFAHASPIIAGHLTSFSSCMEAPFGIWSDSGDTKPTVHLKAQYPIAFFDRHHMVCVSNIPWRLGQGGELDIDESGNIRYVEQPLRKPISEVIRTADLMYEHRMREYSLPDSEAYAARRVLRSIWLYPHQDTGTRISEGEFIQTLISVINDTDAPASRNR